MGLGAGKKNQQVARFHTHVPYHVHVVVGRLYTLGHGVGRFVAARDTAEAAVGRPYIAQLPGDVYVFAVTAAVAKSVVIGLRLRGAAGMQGVPGPAGSTAEDFAFCCLVAAAHHPVEAFDTLGVSNHAPKRLAVGRGQAPRISEPRSVRSPQAGGILLAAAFYGIDPIRVGVDCGVGCGHPCGVHCPFD